MAGRVGTAARRRAAHRRPRSGRRRAGHPRDRWDRRRGVRLAAVPLLYRVFPYVATAAEEEPGSAVYVPPQGGGRLDNPGIYSILYLSDAPAGAIAEAFGRFPEWNEAILEGTPSLAGSARAIARFNLPDDTRSVTWTIPCCFKRWACAPPMWSAGTILAAGHGLGGYASRDGGSV
ncbi:hypothetical protein SBA4_3770012 [Candidatus Sulfopaludibacter sp. SbA4]|nr:hypothetical protein SBA4_3770012 [Candidatus Sulfopaludibacter sp. SbA4]